MKIISFQLLFTLVLAMGASVTVVAQQLPRFELDPEWPKLPLGDNWLTGGLGGICIDSRDHLFVLNRQNVVPDDLDGARMAPPVIEFAADGTLVQGWGDEHQLGGRLHDCHVDEQQNIWIVAAASGVLRKYSLLDQTLVQQLGETGQYDSSDGTREGSSLNSDRAQFFLPASVDVDKETGDIYVADGELPGGNQRIVVLNASGEFLRQWPLHRAENEVGIIPLPHCLRLSNDGLVYVCDRQADRVQVFDKQGTFLKNMDVGFTPITPEQDRASGSRGSAVVLAFSADPEQRFLYVVNQNKVKVDVLDRQSGQLLSSFGYGPGTYRGQFSLPHGIAVDSLGNVYVAEQEGRRIQKFNFMGIE